MPAFQVPPQDLVPPVYVGPERYMPVPKLSARLFRHYKSRARGPNLFKLIDGTYTYNQPYPYDETTVAVTYYGGHIYTVDATEAAALTAAGFTVT